jgi:hypothetical protein
LSVEAGAILPLVKLLTRSEAETKRRKAVEFLRRIGKDEDADRFEAMDAGEYAEHKGAELLENPPRRRTIMKRPKNRPQLEAELEDAHEYIEELETKLDSIAGIASGDGDEADEESNSDDDDQD